MARVRFPDDALFVSQETFAVIENTLRTVDGDQFGGEAESDVV